MTTPSDKRDYPIFVDMDGTLVKTDVAHELLLQSMKSAGKFFHLCKLVTAGFSHIKHYLASNTEFSVENLPYNSEVLSYIEEQKQAGRKIILATATDSIIAEQVAAHVAIFDDVISSTPGNNLKGKAKLTAIQSYVDGGEFEYIGDAKVDMPIWRAATTASFVGVSASARAQVSDKASHGLVASSGKEGRIKSLLKAMRPHQWAKNALVFLPLIFSHTYNNLDAVIAALLTFVVFSLAASGIYLINDLLDIEADRAHAKKRKRPFAAGNLLPFDGVIASIILVTLPLLICINFLNAWVLAVVIVYLILTNVYSFYLKHFSTVDVVALTCLYTIRIIAGGVAIGAVLSPWLINFSLFFFLSLAYMKRYIELSNTKKNGKIKGRNYDVGEMDVMQTTGIVNSGLAILTLSMYLNDQFVVEAYASPKVLWMILPLLMIWVYRAWLWVKRGKIDDDPVVFALKDRVSVVTVALGGVLVMFAKFVPLAGLGA